LGLALGLTSRLTSALTSALTSGELLSGLRCQPTLHRQHNAELRVAAQHARVSLASFFERVGFDHGAHASQFGEAQRVLGVNRCARSPALNCSTAEDELYRRDLNGISTRTYD